MRTSFAALAALLAASAAASPPADARPSRARPAAEAAGPSVMVDVSRLRALGLGQIADLIQASVAQELAAGIGPNVPRATVRLTGLSMATYGGPSGGGGGRAAGSGGSDSDYLEGDYVLFGPGGQVIAQNHQVVSSPASAGAPNYVPGSEQRRIQALSRAFADWLKRAG